MLGLGGGGGGGECSLVAYRGKLIKLTLWFWWKFQVGALGKETLLILRAIGQKAEEEMRKRANPCEISQPRCEFS